MLVFTVSVKEKAFSQIAKNSVSEGESALPNRVNSSPQKIWLLLQVSFFTLHSFFFFFFFLGGGGGTSSHLKTFE